MPTTAAEPASTRNIQTRFLSLFEPNRPDLERYCRAIAGSSWEADDLVQETALKAFLMFARRPFQEEMPKYYLFRIASNAWIDRCRKDRIRFDSPTVDEFSPAAVHADPIEIKSAIETLVAYLPARQRVIVLLIDVFRYTACEVAKMIGATEGAVKSGLHRARSKLKSLAENGADSEQPANVDENLVYTYLEAFQKNNPYALLMLLNDETSQRAVPAIQAVGSVIRPTPSAAADFTPSGSFMCGFGLAA